MNDISIDYTAMGNRMRTARKEKGYTQEKLAELIGVTTGHVGSIERGKAKIGLETFVRICRVLGVTPDQLLFDSAFQPKTVTNHEMAELLNRATPAQLKKAVKLVETMMEE
jgi:transcriptional regulator with XRE-family HTH domain